MVEHVGLAQTVPSVPLREQPDGKNQLNSRYTKKSNVKDYKSSWVAIDFVITSTMHADVSKIISLVDITSVKH